MVENCSQSYLDNDVLLFSGHQLANQLTVYIQDPLRDSMCLELKIHSWIKIFEFKQQIQKLQPFQSYSPSDFRLFHKNIELVHNQKALSDYNIGAGSVILVQRRNKIQLGSKGAINPYKLFEGGNMDVAILIQKSKNAINEGVVPALTSEGTSGVYLIQKSSQKISIFKPFDEEVNAPNNPRGRRGKLGSDGISKGILSGECATREVAAYLLDSEMDKFHGVPTTTYVQFYHPSFTHQEYIAEIPIVSSQQFALSTSMTKHGSLQQFVASEGLIGDYGAIRFTDRQVHKIGILDIRILNCDRNQENILVKHRNDKLTLIPIDHGLSFPDNLEIYDDSLLWMSYPQSKRPFSQQQLKFIEDINPKQNAEMLESKLGFRQICLRNFRIAQIFLKKAASMGFTLYEIGKFLYRSQDYESGQNEKGKSKRSSIEVIVMQAQNLYLTAVEQMEKENLWPGNDGGDFNVDDCADSISEGESESETEQKNTVKSASTCGSIKSMLLLRKKVSLPQLKKKDTSFHELRSQARKSREGVNGVSKTVWSKYYQQEWNELFYYYFENLLDTFLLQKSMAKSRKLNLRTESAK